MTHGRLLDFARSGFFLSREVLCETAGLACPTTPQMGAPAQRFRLDSFGRGGCPGFSCFGARWLEIFVANSVLGFPETSVGEGLVFSGFAVFSAFALSTRRAAPTAMALVRQHQLWKKAGSRCAAAEVSQGGCHDCEPTIDRTSS